MEGAIWGPFYHGAPCNGMDCMAQTPALSPSLVHQEASVAKEDLQQLEDQLQVPAESVQPDRLGSSRISEQ